MKNATQQQLVELEALLNALNKRVEATGSFPVVKVQFSNRKHADQWRDYLREGYEAFGLAEPIFATRFSVNGPVTVELLPPVTMPKRRLSQTLQEFKRTCS